ncbi:MAG: hypothetical protein KDC38_07755 [Planctomycetes bacterium]|nr:hypothetical protein [Planctomycetota bacterium]
MSRPLLISLPIAIIVGLGIGWSFGPRVPFGSPAPSIAPDALVIEIDPEPEDVGSPFLVFIAPEGRGSILSTSPEVSLPDRRVVVRPLEGPGSYRVLVTDGRRRTRVDTIVVAIEGRSRRRILVPSSSRPPPETGIVVRAVDAEGQPVRVSHAVAWIQQGGRVSRADLPRGATRSDGATLFAIGTVLYRALITPTDPDPSESPASVELWVECDHLWGQWVSVPPIGTASEVEARRRVTGVTPMPIVDVSFARSTSPTAVVEEVGGRGLEGRLSVSLEHPEHGVRSMLRERCDNSGRAVFPRVAPGPYRVRLWLSPLPPFSEEVLLVDRQVDWGSGAIEQSISAPPLFELAFRAPAGSSTTEWQWRRDPREGDPIDGQTLGSFVVHPDERLEVAGLPAGFYRASTSDPSREVRFELPGPAEVDLVP